MYEHVHSLQDFRALDATQQRECVAERKAAWEKTTSDYIDQRLVDLDLERRLVPSIRFTTAKPEAPSRQIEVGTAVKDVEGEVREFFRRNPDTKEIRIGNDIYQRGTR